MLPTSNYSLCDILGMSAQKVEFADALRGIAALCVMTEHYSGFFFGDRNVIGALINAPPLAASKTLTPDYLSWAFSIPHFILSSFGVALFFVISGFVIPYSVKGSSIPGYLIGRVFRIYPLYMVGFAITLLSIYLSGHYFGRLWHFNFENVWPHFFPGLHSAMGAPSIDGIIWTLEIEIKFYLICALIAPLIRKQSPLLFATQIAIVALDHLLTKGFFAAPFVCFMFIGTAFHFVYTKALTPTMAAFVASSIFAAFGLSISFGPISYLATIIPSYGLAVLCFAAATLAGRFFRPNKPAKFFADISYPLYVIHGVAGFAMIRFLIEVGIEPWLAVPIVATVVIALARILNLTVERWSRNFGRSIVRRLRQPVPTPSTSTQLPAEVM